MMYIIYGVSGDALKSMFAYTGCLPLHIDIILGKLKFLKDCNKTNNSVLHFTYACFGCKELIQCCIHQLNLDESNVSSLSFNFIKRTVFDVFISSF